MLALVPKVIIYSTLFTALVMYHDPAFRLMVFIVMELVDLSLSKAIKLIHIVCVSALFLAHIFNRSRSPPHGKMLSDPTFVKCGFEEPNTPFSIASRASVRPKS